MPRPGAVPCAWRCLVNASIASNKSGSIAPQSYIYSADGPGQDASHPHAEPISVVALLEAAIGRSIIVTKVTARALFSIEIAEPNAGDFLSCIESVKTSY